MLKNLRELGAAEILREASGTVKINGFRYIVPYDPYSGTVNIYGALAMACNAKPKDVQSWSGELEFAPVHGGLYGIFMEIISYLELYIDKDIDEWSAVSSEKEVVRMLMEAADKLEIAVI